MAEEKKKFISEEGGKEIVDNILALLEDLASNEALQEALSKYTDTNGMNAAIKSAVEASEKKIFGDGELAEAFDTIQEIGAYLKDHDEVAEAINQAIAQKLGKEEAAGIYQKISDMAQYVTSTSLTQTLGSYVKSEDLEETLGEYVKSEDLEGAIQDAQIEAVPVATIQGWFKRQ